jgi:phosphatidylserine/phosphatidylglycerophosphate/cardiolipin synthase-like enzyme
MSKASKRRDSVEVSTSTVLSTMRSRAASTARSALELVLEHRWKAVGAAVIAVVGLMMGLGFINVGKLASSLTQYATLRTGQSGATESARDSLSAVEAVTPSSPSITTCFTPEENCTSQILAAIDGARAEILVQADSFTTRSVIDALGRARQRGVKVHVILDKADERERISGGARLISQRILPQVEEERRESARDQRPSRYRGCLRQELAAAARGLAAVLRHDGAGTLIWRDPASPR